MTTWPASLPQTLEIGASENFVKGFIRTPVDQGPSKSRRLFTSTPRVHSGTMLFDNAQRVTFDTFYKTTLAEGSLEFDFIDPIDLSTVSARFVEPPTFALLSGSTSGVGLYRGSFVIELLV